MDNVVSPKLLLYEAVAAASNIPLTPTLQKVGHSPWVCFATLASQAPISIDPAPETPYSLPVGLHCSSFFRLNLLILDQGSYKETQRELRWRL